MSGMGLLTTLRSRTAWRAFGTIAVLLALTTPLCAQDESPVESEPTQVRAGGEQVQDLPAAGTSTAPLPDADRPPEQHTLWPDAGDDSSTARPDLPSEPVEAPIDGWQPDEPSEPVLGAEGDRGDRDGECNSGGCTNFTTQYPSGTQSTTSSSFVVISTCQFGGDYARCNVTSAYTYEWSLCSADGGVVAWDAQLTLRNQSGSRICYSDDYCDTTRPKIRWTATYTGYVDILVSKFNCANANDCNTLVWRCASCGGQADLTPYQPAHWNNKIPIGITQLPWSDPHTYDGPYYSNQTLYFNWASANIGNATASNYCVRIQVTGAGGGTWESCNLTTPPGNYTCLTYDQAVGPLSAGSHTFKVWVDYYNTVAESNESNNYYERTIYVDIPTQPDLTPYQPSHWNDKIPIGITQLGWQNDHTYSGEYYDNQTLYFNWASANMGNATASNYCVRIQVTGAGGGTWESCNLTTPPGNYTCLTYDQAVGPLSAGSHTFKVWVDYYNTVPESNEANNYYERTISVQPGVPDIRVEPTSLVFTCSARGNGQDGLGLTGGDGRTPVKAIDLTDPASALGPVAPDQIIVRFTVAQAAALHVERMLLVPGDAGAWLNSAAAAQLQPLPEGVLGLAPFVSGYSKMLSKLKSMPEFAAFADTVAAGEPLPAEHADSVAAVLAKVQEPHDPIGMFYARVAPHTDLRAVCLELMRRGDIVYAHPSPVCHPTDIPNDPLYPRMWNLSRIAMPPAWDVSGNILGGVRVCVVDTGVRISHAELAGRSADPKDVYLGNGDAYGDSNPDNDDESGHGTACAGIIASIRDNSSLIAGIAPITIIPVNCYGPGGNIYNYTDGIRWGVDHNADVLSLSFGRHGALYQDEIDAANYAEARGVLVCAAAGNENGNADDFYPAALPYYVSVGAVDDDDIRVRPPKWWWGSNFGNTLDICAPGQGDVGASNDSILTLGRDSNTDWRNDFNGTSAATPHVAGLVALLLHINSGLTAAQVRDIIESTATDQVGDPTEDTPGWDPYHGHGLINAAAGANKAAGCFTIYNDGGATLQVSSISKPSWIALTPAPPYSIPAGGSQVVCGQIDCGACAGTDLDGTLLIYSNDPDQNPVQVAVHVDCPALPVSVSGNVRDGSGNAIEGVLVSANNGGGSDTTGNDGYYALTVPYNWSGRVTPSKTGWTFSPAYRDYSSVTSNQTNQNYTGAPVHDCNNNGVPDELEISPLPRLLVTSKVANSVFAFHADGSPWGIFAAPGAGLMRDPNGIAIDGNDVYVASVATDSVIKFSGLTGQVCRIYAGGGLDGPVGVVIRAPELLVASNFTHEVLAYDLVTGTSRVLVPAHSGGLTNPGWLLLTPNGHLLVASEETDQVLEYDAQTGAFFGVATIGGGLDLPTGMIFDAHSNLLVSSYYTSEVLEYAPNGTFLRPFVTSGSGGLSLAQAIIWAPDGNLLVCNRGGNNILEFLRQDGSYVRVFAEVIGPETLALGWKLRDCNGNGVPDECDIASGISQDVNDNGVPDECEPMQRLADLNCDRGVDFADIDPFVLALSDPAAYQAAYPNCNVMNGDCNGDGNVDFGDIDPFVALLSG